VDELKNLLRWCEAIKASMDWDDSSPTHYMFDEAMQKARQRVVAGIWAEQSEVCRQALDKIRQVAQHHG
jgi:hypothetical protein